MRSILELPVSEGRYDQAFVFLREQKKQKAESVRETRKMRSVIRDMVAHIKDQFDAIRNREEPFYRGIATNLSTLDDQLTELLKNQYSKQNYKILEHLRRSLQTQTDALS